MLHSMLAFFPILGWYRLLRKNSSEHNKIEVDVDDLALSLK